MRANTGARFTLRPMADQRAGFARHAGARHFAFDWCVENNKKVYAQSKEDKRIKVPRSTFDYIGFPSLEAQP